MIKKVVTLVGAEREMLTKVITVPRFTMKRKAGGRRVINKIGERKTAFWRIGKEKTSFRRGSGVLANYMPKSSGVEERDCFEEGYDDPTKYG